MSTILKNTGYANKFKKEIETWANEWRLSANVKVIWLDRGLTVDYTDMDSPVISLWYSDDSERWKIDYWEGKGHLVGSQEFNNLDDLLDFASQVLRGEG